MQFFCENYGLKFNWAIYMQQKSKLLSDMFKPNAY